MVMEPAEGMPVPQELGGGMDVAMDTWVVQDSISDGTTVVIPEPGRYEDVRCDMHELMPGDVVISVGCPMHDGPCDDMRATVRRLKDAP
jgi:hypothetical protein